MTAATALNPTTAVRLVIHTLGTATATEHANLVDARRAIVDTVTTNGWHRTGGGDAGTMLDATGQVAGAYAIAPLVPTTWRAMPSPRLRAILDVIDDATDEWDDIANELAERDHTWETRRNNGGIMP